MGKVKVILLLHGSRNWFLGSLSRRVMVISLGSPRQTLMVWDGFGLTDFLKARTSKNISVIPALSKLSNEK